LNSGFHACKVGASLFSSGCFGDGGVSQTVSPGLASVSQVAGVPSSYGSKFLLLPVSRSIRGVMLVNFVFVKWTQCPFYLCQETNGNLTENVTSDCSSGLVIRVVECCCSLDSCFFVN
jgi:hypothetical protein